MPHLAVLFLLHLAPLVGVSRATTRRLFAAGLPRRLAVAVLARASFGLTGIAHSPLRPLGAPIADFAGSSYRVAGGRLQIVVP